MVASVVIVTLLTIVASLASWLFSQWLARRARVSGAALAVGGVGAVLLIGAVALVVVTASMSWRRLMPVQELDDVPYEWPATECVIAMRADESAHWILDNDCGSVVAVLFASCPLSETACFTNALVSRDWSYEPAGILMTAANDKPVALRLADDGPMVAPIFTIRDVAGVRRQIRYLACQVTAPRVLQLLQSSGVYEPTSQLLTTELRADPCYSQVLDWSRSGHRLGASPDALLRLGIN